MTRPALNQDRDDLLFERVAQIVADTFGRRSTIAAIYRKRSEYSSFYASEILSVQLDTGDELKMFLKNFGSYPDPKDAMEQRRNRELHVYRDILARASLGTAKYYGSVWDEPEGPFWLLLELVRGIAVRHCSFDYWVEAARWLGHMQGYFYQNSGLLQGHEFLIQHDGPFFRSARERAFRAVSQRSPDLGKRLAAALSPYDQSVELMMRQPKTLVHGAYRPAEILVDASERPARICPVDWEQAAIGSGFYDLAFLADGFKSPQLEQILDAYCTEAANCGLQVPDQGSAKHIVNCYRLHKTVTWLSQSFDRKFPEKDVMKLVSMAEKLAGLVLSNRTACVP
ncbi:MAG: hypothetical protein DMG13_05880 [Acidobacteria bacterium]|nr:MAG: hypothetical protein DMG13_05880 [Acidobacteriota bacterium]